MQFRQAPTVLQGALAGGIINLPLVQSKLALTWH